MSVEGLQGENPAWCMARPMSLLPLHGVPPLTPLTPLSPLEPLGGPLSQPPPPLRGVSVSLQNADLWRQFHQAGTEMIITKLGRRMFPALRLRISGLEPDARYFVLLELVLAAPNRFKFSGGRWVSVGAADTQPLGSRVHAHQDSPAPGAAWTSREVSFHRAKLTNNTLDRAGNLVLTSMHRYLPRVHVVRASDVLALRCSPTATFTFPETEFVAVTAYQNDRITKMKIDHNPFAKGFRETGMSRCKRKQMAQESQEHEDRHYDTDTDGELTVKQECSDTRSVSSRSSHDDSGVSSLGSASPSPSDTSSPVSPAATPPTNWASSTPVTAAAAPAPATSAPKCSLSIERLLAKDDTPRRPRPLAVQPVAYYPYPAYVPYAPYAPYDPWVDPLYMQAMHGLAALPPAYPHPAYMYPYPHSPYPQGCPQGGSLASAGPSISDPVPAEPGVVDLSVRTRRDEPSDLRVKRERVEY